MVIPEDIRKVERPVNTVVIDSGKDSPHRYAVRERAGSKYVPGNNNQPVNGKVIGHIIDGKFVPKSENPENPIEHRSYGAIALARSVSEDICSDLQKKFPEKASFIMAISLLRATLPEITDNRIQTEYDDTAVGVFLPDLSFSENKIQVHLKELESKKNDIFDYYRIRSASTESKNLAIAGTTVTWNQGIMGYRAVSDTPFETTVIYAYDIETGDILFLNTYPHREISPTLFLNFVLNNTVRSGTILLNDVPVSEELGEELERYPNLHYIAKEDGSTSDDDDTRFYYTDRSDDRTRFVSDVIQNDLEKIMEKRSVLDRIIRSYLCNGGGACNNDLINTVVTGIAYRMFKKMCDSGLLKDDTFGQVLRDLQNVTRAVNGILETPTRHDNLWADTSNRLLDMMESLGLCSPEPTIPEKRGRGRPRKAGKPE